MLFFKRFLGGLLALGMHPLKVLLHVAFLVEAEVAAFKGADEGLLVGVDAQVSIELAQTAEDLVAGLAGLVVEQRGREVT